MPLKSKTVIKKTKERKLCLCIIMGLLCLGFASTIYAAGDIGAIEKAIHGVRDILTGPIAKSLAVVAIIGIGYITQAGKMAWQTALMVCLGIGIVFGAKEIAELLGAG